MPEADMRFFDEQSNRLLDRVRSYLLGHVCSSHILYTQFSR